MKGIFFKIHLTTGLLLANWILTHSIPDLSYAVLTLSQFMQSPRSSHLLALEHTLKYLKGIPGQGIFLQANGHLILKAFSDSHWASCSFSRRSITGYMILLDTTPMSWKSKKQPTVSKSSAEAEYRAMFSSCCWSYLVGSTTFWAWHSSFATCHSPLWQPASSSNCKKSCFSWEN